MTDAPKRYRGQRGPNRVKKVCMKAASIRLPQEVLDYYGGSSIKMREVLVNHMQRSRAMDELVAFSEEAGLYN